jgi:hypothetical protein
MLMKLYLQLKSNGYEPLAEKAIKPLIDNLPSVFEQAYEILEKGWFKVPMYDCNFELRDTSAPYIGAIRLLEGLLPLCSMLRVPDLDYLAKSNK